MSDTTPGYPPIYEVPAFPDVVPVSRPKPRYWLHILLLLGTIFTTLVVGSRLQFNFAHALPAYGTDEDLLPFAWALAQPSRLLMGIPFSLTLMGILLAHEMGHYIACVRYRVYATLPFFIPAPTIIGTLGAFIRIKSPIPTRRALFDIGIAGPIAGFCVALPVLLIAMFMSQASPSAAESQIQLNFSLIFELAHLLVGPTVDSTSVALHPIGVAAWVGMFATALNLLPGGQLDGGHIIYSLWPRAHRKISIATAVLLVCGTYLWRGWLIWAVLLLVSGLRHPHVGAGYSPYFDDTHYEDPWAPLGRRRVLLAILAAFMLFMTFIPTPYRVLG